ncbi:MAG: hypothetical protein NVV70_06595 [Cellulomonas sp.]|nr:hypothetical protein [Cellulomonas sp.]MCR6647813.1 hypothetical protein [Cellulomonas sp.]
MGLVDEPPLCDLAAIPWGSKMLRRLGESIRDGTAAPPDGPQYMDIIRWYDELAASVQIALRELDWTSLLDGRSAPEITSRAKTLDTLRQKLQRDRHRPLSSVQDIAGVRFEAEMTLEEQDVVAAAIAAAFDHGAECIHDLRSGEHSGYRAVHVWLRLPQGRVEVQVRTHVQGAWANAYEALADIVGRGIRYGEPDPDPTMQATVEALQNHSINTGAHIERTRQTIARFELVLEDRRRSSDASRRFIRNLEQMLDQLRSESQPAENQYTTGLQALAHQLITARARGRVSS